eukprot:1148519-Pelagomonas_calceolata.AAC.3
MPIVKVYLHDTWCRACFVIASRPAHIAIIHSGYRNKMLQVTTRERHKVPGLRNKRPPVKLVQFPHAPRLLAAICLVLLIECLYYVPAL